MATRRLTNFVSDIVRARDLVALGQSIGSLTQGRVDATDVYRAALVQGVAALDSYVHGVVLDRAVDTLLGRLAHGGADNKVGLHFTAVGRILAAQNPIDQEFAARSSIGERLALETYQRSDNIAKALSMVGVPRIWSLAFTSSSATAITALNLIVTRRNRIVHQCDIDVLTPGQPTPLSAVDALASIDTVEVTVRAIDQHC